MTVVKKYKAVSARDWRQQELPCHPALFAVQERIGSYLERLSRESLVTVNPVISTIVEVSVNYCYQQWIEQHADYPDDVHDRGMQLYAFSVVLNPLKKPIQTVYLKGQTAERIIELGDFINMTCIGKIPHLMSPRWKNVYNRKLIIILAMNVLSESLS